MRKFAIAGVVVAVIAAAMAIKATLGIPRDAVFGADGPATKAAVLNVVPIDSSIGSAKATMETKGFHCIMMYNRTHAGFDPSNPQHLITYPKADYLWCDSGDRWTGWRSLIITKRWQISFVSKDQKVVSVDVGVSVTGP